jgi:hypothetical protein
MRKLTITDQTLLLTTKILLMYPREEPPPWSTKEFKSMILLLVNKIKT